jgi:hypothetical protein
VIVLVLNTTLCSLTHIPSLLLGHSQDSGEGDHSVGAEHSLRRQQHHGSNLLQSGLLGPGSKRLTSNVDLDIDESSLLKILLHLLTVGRRGTSRLLHSLGKVVKENLDRVVLLHGSVVATQVSGNLLELNPSSGLGATVGVLKDLVPVTDTLDKVTHVDKVERVLFITISFFVSISHLDSRRMIYRSVSPLLFSIVDLELAVRRNPSRLNWGKVGSDNLSAGVLLGNIDSPDTGSSSDIENLLGFRIDRSLVKVLF